MARLGRYFVEGQALHMIQRGNDRQAIFDAEGERRIGVRHRFNTVT
jgi:hypothetical protein